MSESIAVKEELGDRKGRAASLVMLGQMRFGQGERVEGLAQVEEAAAVLRAIGDGRAAQVEAIAAQMREAGPGVGGGASGAVERLNAANQALQRGDRKAARRLAKEARVMAKAEGAERALPDALFLLGMASEEEAERHELLTQALTLLEAQGRNKEAAAVRKALVQGAAGRPAWADAVEAALGKGDLGAALAMVDAARREAARSGNAQEVKALEAVAEQLQGAAMAQAPRERRPGEVAEQQIERLMQRALHELRSDDAEGARVTCAALMAAGKAAGPSAHMQAGLSAAQVLTHLGDFDAAEAHLAACEALLPDLPDAQMIITQVRGLLSRLRREQE